MTQAFFDFQHSELDYKDDNFLVSGSNREAYEFINSFPWQFYAANICGEKSCGKSHLAKIATEIADKNSDKDLLIIEDLSEQANEEELFHILNSQKEHGNFVLITSPQPISRIKFKLPDLKSRIAAIPSIEINPPEDELFYMLLARKFFARQLRVSDEVVNYLMNRLERSYLAIDEAIVKLDKLSLQEKRNITIPLVKKAMD
ncbi:MAG: hypothetical protein COV36_05655 [Alphaproteobacteria bacterium CG11_big_fil_rev_8_21_14_0_20_44_7]|nr:MAG: hypothetical protein COV36_05655 [Alphaproteobacteria bacterium CG11_big_fil_rev_8_21_14_0_20_44_7]